MVILMNNLKKNINKRGIIIIICIILLIIIDQVTKTLAIELLTSDKTVIKGVLEFCYTKNSGIAFGMASDNKFIIIISNIIVLGLIARFMIIQNKRINNTTMIILSAIVSGGISNLLDRIVRGYVVDFIKIFPIFNFPIINIADILIFIGWIVLAFTFALNTYTEFKKRGN